MIYSDTPITPNYGTSKTALQERQAGMSRKLYDEWVATFVPKERQLIGMANDPGAYQKRVDDAVGVSTRAFDASKQSTDVKLEMYGSNLTGNQQKARNLQNNLARDSSQINASNASRRNEADQQEALQRNMVQLGRQTQQDGINQLNSAASLEYGRNQRNASAKAQAKAANEQAATSIATTAATLFFMSSEKAKHKIKKADPIKSLNLVRSTDLKEYEYLPEYVEGNKAIPGVVTGGMVEQMPKEFTQDNQQSVQKTLGHHTGALQAIANELEALKKKVA